MTVYTLKKDQYSSHMKLVRFINRLLTRSKVKKKILDVGCSKGYIGAHLKKEKVELYGLERDPHDAAIARKYYQKVKVIDLDSKDYKLPKKSFDIILIASVIEHLKEPEKVLAQIKSLLKKDGILIMSTSNIVNIYARLKILFGNFDYAEKGIFDRTHLHFYTLKTFRQLVKKAGFIIIEEDFTPIPLPNIHPLFAKGSLFYPFHQLNYAVMRLWKRLFCFEFILYCKKI